MCVCLNSEDYGYDIIVVHVRVFKLLCNLKMHNVQLSSKHTLRQFNVISAQIKFKHVANVLTV